MVAEVDVISLLPDWQPYFYRTSQGAGFDLVISRRDESWTTTDEIRYITVPDLPEALAEFRKRQ